jgi:hypothetical protein
MTMTDDGGRDRPGRDRRAMWARREVAQRVLETVSGAFGDAGIDVLAVKGVVTAEWLYERAGDRPLVDVDIRIRSGDFKAAIKRSAREGWAIERRVWSYRNLVLGVDGLAVDVECYIGPPAFAAVSVDEVLRRATKDARGFWIPETYDHALLLTINVFKDKLTHAMPWAIEDVARVVDLPGFDVNTYIQRVREARVAGLTWIVADWMADRRGHATWRTIRSLLGGDAPARRRYTAVMRRLLRDGDTRGLPVRVLGRAASDDVSRWPVAMGLALAWELESRWDARRYARERARPGDR